MKIPVEYYPAVDGSMTSPDGQVFLLKVRTEDGQELMLGFPHREISNIVECAAMQMDHGRNQGGEKIVSAFKTPSFELGRGPAGETVLSFGVGETGRISFLIPPAMVAQLLESVGRIETRH